MRHDIYLIEHCLTFKAAYIIARELENCFHIVISVIMMYLKTQTSEKEKRKNKQNNNDTKIKEE